MKKEMENLFLIAFCIVLTLPIASAITGSSSSYNSWTEASFCIYNSSGTSYGSRGAANHIVGNFSKTYTGRFGLDYYPNTAPPVPALTAPLNNSQQVYNNLTFEWSSVTDPDGDTVTYELRFLNDSFDQIGLVSGLTSNSHTNSSLNDSWQYWTVRSYDNTDYSSWNSSYYYVDNVNATITISSPTEGQVLRPGNSLTVTATQNTRSDWITSFKIFTGGTDCSATNNSAAGDSSWSCTYTAASDATTSMINVDAYAYNNTEAENVSDSAYFYIVKTTGPAIAAPRITNFYPNVTYLNGTELVGVTLDIDLDVLNKTVTLTVTYPNSNTTTLSPDNIVSDDTNFDYNYYYSFLPTEAGEGYFFEASVTDQNDQSNTSNFTIWVKNPTSVNLTTVGGTNIAVKDINSGITLESGTSINKSFVTGEYNIDITTAIGTITLNNATLNETNMAVLNYVDKSDTVAPTNTIAIDRFEMSSEQMFSNNARIVYDYSSTNASVINENNLKAYKCSSESSCTWSELTRTVDSDADTVTITFDSFSIFIVAEDVATLTTTVAAAGVGGGAALQKASVKIITPAALEHNPLKMLLQDTVRIPLRIKNTGTKLLTGVSLTWLSENPLINLELDKTFIPRLAAGSSEIVMATVTSALTEPGIYAVKLVSSAGFPQVSDESELIIAVVTILEEKVEQIITRVVFAKDLFKEHPECLELQELLGKADEAIKNNEYERARMLTETAILGCQDMITALTIKKEVLGRLPFTKQQIIILMVVGSSILTIITLLIISPKKRQRVFEKTKRIKIKLPKVKFELLRLKKPKTKNVDIWKRR